MEMMCPRKAFKLREVNKIGRVKTQKGNYKHRNKKVADIVLKSFFHNWFYLFSASDSKG